MARMTPDEWRKKKEEEAQGTSASPATYSAPNTNTEQSSTSSGRMSPIEWKAKKSTSSLQAWTSYAKSLLSQNQNYFSTWRKYDDTDEEYTAIRNHRSNLLAQADTWRKMYAGNADALAHIDSVVSALSESSDFATKGFDYYSQWATNDDYQKALREQGYLQKYEGLTYKDIQSKLGQMDDGEEKTWLTDYGKQVDFTEKVNLDLDVAKTEIFQMKKLYQNAREAKPIYDAYTKQPESYSNPRVKEKVDIYSKMLDEYGSLSALEEALAETKDYLKQAEYSQQVYYYATLKDRPDFAEKSKYKTTYRGGEEFSALVGMYTDTGFDDIQYDTINGNQKARDRQKLEDIATNTVFLGLDKEYLYEMEPEEVQIYNYLYDPNDKTASDEYLAFILSDLNYRRREATEKWWTDYAKEDPVGSSLFSVLIAPTKALTALGQYADYTMNGTIDQNAGYNKFSWSSSAIRTEVANEIALSGKWGSVGSWTYQLGMSMGDFLMNTAVSGGNPKISLAVMGSGAFADTVISSKDRGLSDDQAFTLGVVAAGAEIITEKLSLDALLDMDLSKGVARYVFKNMLVEGTEEVSSSMINLVADIYISKDKSEWNMAIQDYLDKHPNASKEDAFRNVFMDTALSLGLDFLGGSLMGGTMAKVGATINSFSTNEQIIENQGALTQEALEINPDNRFAQKMQSKLDDGKNLNVRQFNKLIKKNEKALISQDMQSIQSATESRLTELGETGDVTGIAAALTKQVAGKKLSKYEQQLIAESKYGQRVANELNTENIQSGDYASAWAENIGTERINVQEYSRLLQAAQMPQETAETAGDQVATEAQNEAQAIKGEASPATKPEARTVDAAEVTTANPEARMVDSTEATEQEIAQVAGESTVTDETQPETETVTLENVSQNYGAQAQAMVSTYNEGQDVAKYDAAYKVAYDMGKSGVSLSYVMKSDAASYLTKEQRQLAYNTGRDAADAEAKAKDANNKKGANGKTGRKKGVVRGDGVTVKDLDGAFNMTQGKAYKYLTDVAEATGIDIVLYRSDANAEGKYEDAQGKYDRNDPGTLYIDLNAGLRDITDEGKLHRYFMLRTFAHEFTHFIENWNPIQYNEFRKVVFDTMTERGENVHDLIEEMQRQNPGMSYDKASREVVAEAMVDVLPESNFVQELAQNHKGIFRKLLDMLKEFVANIRAYYNTIGGTYDRGAVALKEHVGDTLKYLDSIVQAFDKVAVQAVENFQQTVATEEVAVSEMETTTTDAATEETTTSEHGFTITDNAQFGSLEITFDGKPPVQVRDVLKENKFRWNGKKGVWYGKADRSTITEELNKAFEAVNAVAENPAMQTLREMGAKPIGENGLDVTDLMFPQLKQQESEEALVPTTPAIRSEAEEAEQIYGQDAAPTLRLMNREYVVQRKSNGTYSVSVVSSKREGAFAGTDVAKDGFTSFADASEYAIRWILANDLEFKNKWKKTYAKLTAGQSEFEQAFWNATQEERDEVVEAINQNTKISHMAPTEIRESADAAVNEEVNANVENVDNQGTVQQSEPDGSGVAPVLDERETGDVPGDGIDGDAVADTSERGQQTVRDGGEPDHSERNVGGHGEGSSQGGDLRGSDRVSPEEQSARDYATQNGYGLKINSLTSKKGMTQVDIYDRNGLPTSRYVMINEVSDWNKVKQEIDKHGEWEQERAERLHKETVEQIAQQSTEQPKGRNFVIGDSLDLPNGEKSRYKANIEAIQLVKKLEAEGRYATEAEQAILSKYVGWGGLANAFDQKKADWAKEYTELKELLSDEEYTSARGSTLNAHYTDISVIKAMYDGLKQLGFAGGRMLEPSSGVGNFVGAMPADMASQVRSWTMVELDGITGLIAKYLYPNADVRIQGFEKANIPNNFMDVAISNVPFGNYAIADKAYPKKVTSAIHNYFFAKTLDKVRPGGIVMFITSSYTMNAKDSTVRRYIMQKADLLGAIRLPDSAFKGNAGTEVVTDILVLKKRADNTVYAGEEFLEAPYQYIDGFYSGANVNKYFLDHPEMVLGKATMTGGMYRGDSLTYKALEGKGTLADQIREAFKNIQGKMDYPAQLSPEKTNFAVERAGKKTKENGLVVKDGKVYRNTGGALMEQNVAKGAADRISGMLEIRDAAKELQNYLQQGLNDAEIRKARTKLNKAYDAFVKKHGFINSQTNRNAIKADPDSFSILALENWNPETKKATKSDIFSKNTIAANRTVTSAKDVAEGLIVSVNQTGGVDTALIAKLTGKTEAEVTSELLESRQAFKNRDGQLETAEVYLSGNVRAKLRDAEAMVPMDADYQKNVEALKAVVPEDVGYQDIFVNPGTPWIPDSVYSDFVASMLGTVNHEWNKAVDVVRNKDTGNFTVELKNRYLKTNSYNTQKWGTSRRSFLDLFDAMLNSKSVVVKDKLADGSYIINKDATAAANEKIENIQKEFQEWLWKDETRRAELATLYNETFNSVVTPKYNGDNLTVNGANAMKPLRPHQRNAVQRIISSGGNTLLAHKVGAGKTYEMAAAAMKLKQLGLVKKPMFAVPKSLVAQWGNEFMDFFPTAKLLVAEAGDFTAANRKVFMNRIANGDYDAVIVSYEQFEKLPVSDDFTRELYQEQIDSVISAIEEAKAEKGGKSLSVKDLEKKRKSLQTKIDKLSDTAKDEGNIDFEQLGVDSIFVDEAHNFKNLFYTTSMTNVSGLGNKDGSKRAFDLYTKVRYLQKLNGGRGIVFATATPVMNSMSEMYIMQKYLQPDLLDQLGLHTFDAWAKQFGEVVNGVEIKPSGQGYRVKQSFSRFKNMSELQLLFRNFADVLTDIPGLKIPKMKGGRVNVVVCEPGQFQQDYMKELEKRADNIKSVDPSVDNMLKITSDGRKISYTQRMIDPTLPYEEGCKIYRCADNVVELYQDSKDVKGTQLIFCDMATPKGKSNTTTTETEDIETDMESAKLYDDLKARLVKGGIPAKQIAFIHEADTDAKKKKLFADVNDGTVRVLIGSTGKMGVGMNAQKRVVAIHHLDAPWRPGDVEQRNGRAFRQGNINEEVECFTYVTEGSFDARLWDILERKQNFINQVMNGENVGRETEDTGEVTLSAAEVKALASGSPLIMEQVQLDTDIKKLESLYRAHRAAVTNAKSRLEKDKGTIASLEKHIANGKADLATRVDTYSDGKFSISVGKQTFTEKKDAGAALMAAATAKANETGYTTIGKFAGFDLRVIKTHEGIKGLISGQQGYSFNTYPNNTTFMINHLVAAVEGMDGKVQQWEQQLTETRNDLAEQEKLIEQPFAKQAELDQKRARYNEVMEILNPKEEQSLDSVDEDTVQEQSRAYLDEDPYDTQGVHWGMNAGLMTNSEARKVWEAIANIRKRGYYYPRTVSGEHIVSADNALFFVDADYRYPSVNKIIRFNTEYEVNVGYAKELIIDAEGNPARHGEALRNVADIYGEGFALEYDRAVYEADERENGRGEGKNRGTSDSGIGEQKQQRTDSLTDREVLLKASEEVNTFGWDEGQIYALDLLQQSVSKLESLEVERAELGRLYRDQQFGAKVDRAAAAKTLNRMKILDGKIEDANAEVLSIENKKVLREVLQKARQVVEAEERQRGNERLKRWRDRRNNADAIKKYRERLKKDVNDLTGWVLRPNNKDIVKHIPDALKSSVIPFLSSIDFTSKQQLRGGDATKADQEFIKRLNGLKAALKPQLNLGDMYEGYTDLPPNFMERLQNFIDTTQELINSNSGEFVVNQMTADELRELSQVVRTLKEYIQNFNKFHYNSVYQHVHEAGDNSISELGAMNDAGDRTGGLSNFVFWQQMRPAYAWERFGAGGKAIYDGLRRGQAKLAFNTRVILEFSEKAYTEAEVKAWEKEIKEINLGGDTVKMPVSTIMSFYELSKRPQALGHIIGQGVRVATFKKGGKKISDVGHKITIEDVQTIIDTLTERQKEVADKLQKFMQEQGGKWGNYVSLKRFGEELFGDEHYFPINSDGRHLQANADEGPSAASLYALLNMGFTKSVTEGANNRLVLYSIFDVFANHMASMAQYNAMALPVVDALKWFNYQQKSDPDEDGKRFIVGSVRDQMDRVYGVPEETRPGSGKQGYAQTFVVNILKAFNGTEAQGTPTDSFFMRQLHRYNVAQVAYNFRVVVQQPLAITRAALLIDYGSIMKGFKLSPAAIKQNVREMQKYSGIAAWKSLGFYDVNISRGLTDLIKHSTKTIDKINEFGMKGAEAADTWTWAGIWSACKEEVIKKQRLTPKNEGFYEAVTQLFEEVIYKTQVVDSILTKNEYLRSKGLGARLTGAFMSEPTTTASMLIDAYDKYHRDVQKGMTSAQSRKKNGRMIGRTAYVFGLSAVILAAVQAVSDAFRDDDDYEDWYEKWLDAFGGNLIDEAMPFNKLPLFSQVYEFAKEMIAVGGFDIYGQMSNLPYAEIAEKLIKGTEILYDKITGVDTNYTYYAGIYKIFQGLSGISGLPMAAATRELITGWNSIVSHMAPSLKVQTYDPGEKNEIKYAYQDGYLTDEEAAAALLEQGIVDTEDEAYWMIQGWEAGDDYSRYDAIFDAVRNGGDITAAMDELTSHGYEEDDVLRRVKSEIGDWYKNGKITKQQATVMLTKYFDMDSDEITATVNKWSCKVVTGIAYEDIEEEYLNGTITAAKAIEMRVRYGGESKEDAAAVVKKWQYEKDTGRAYDDLREHFVKGKITANEVILSMQQYGGVSKKDAEATVQKWKLEKDTGYVYDDLQDLYIDGKITSDKAITYLQNYGGVYKADAKATVQKWQCEKDTGYAYDDLQELYVNGKITADKAKELRIKYGSESIDDARKTVLKWQCEKDTGIKYSDIDRAYLSGEITEETAINLLIQYGERDYGDARLAVQAYAWRDQNPEYGDLSDSAIDRYITYCDPWGVDISIFYEAKKYTSTIEGDGTSGSVKRQYVQYILSLNIPWEQKNAMWHALKNSSWKEKDTPFY